MNLTEAAKKIEIVVLDVDGVLTDGRIGYGNGADEVKFFNVQDGLGIKLLQRAGLRVGILSGRTSKANLHRASELALDFVYQGCGDKRRTFSELIAEWELDPAQCVYVGDDLVDIPVMKRVGIAVTVGDAPPEVVDEAHWMTVKNGGKGAVREFAEWLLKARGVWEQVIRDYYA